MYSNQSVSLSDSWIAEYVARQNALKDAESPDITVQDVLNALKAYDLDWQTAVGDVKSYCDPNISLPILSDYLPKRISGDSVIQSFDPKALQAKIDATEKIRMDGIRAQQAQIQAIMKAKEQAIQ
jgi:hypothetical protein